VVHAGFPHDVPQAWSAAPRNHPIRTSGIVSCAHHKAFCCALYGHELSTIEERWNTSPDKNGFWDVAEPHGAGLCPYSMTGLCLGVCLDPTIPPFPIAGVSPNCHESQATSRHRGRNRQKRDLYLKVS
jgi:hypothetical protein